jgi:hypothetical protein
MRELIGAGDVELRFRADAAPTQLFHPQQLALGNAQQRLRFGQVRLRHGQVSLRLRHRLHVFVVIQPGHDLTARDRAGASPAWPKRSNPTHAANAAAVASMMMAMSGFMRAVWRRRRGSRASACVAGHSL